METKKCSECGEVKPLNESYKSPYTKEHRRNQCKECWKKYYQNYFKNPEKVKRKNYLYNKRRYKNGERNPLGTNTKCTCYLGIYDKCRRKPTIFSRGMNPYAPRKPYIPFKHITSWNGNR